MTFSDKSLQLRAWSFLFDLLIFQLPLISKPSKITIWTSEGIILTGTMVKASIVLSGSKVLLPASRTIFRSWQQSYFNNANSIRVIKYRIRSSSSRLHLDRITILHQVFFIWTLTIQTNHFMFAQHRFHWYDINYRVPIVQLKLN